MTFCGTTNSHSSDQSSSLFHDGIVISTGAQRSGGTCGFAPGYGKKSIVTGVLSRPFLLQKAIVGLRPDFLLSSMALANSMRLSLKKAAHAVVSSAAYRKSGSPRLFGPGTLWRTWGTRPYLGQSLPEHPVVTGPRSLLGQPVLCRAKCSMMTRCWYDSSSRPRRRRSREKTGASHCYAIV